MLEKREKQIYLEFIRIVAVFLVILNHIDINYYYYHNTDSIITFIISLLVTIIVRINVPLFFMISGVVLIRNYKGISNIYKKKIPRIIIITILFSLIYYLIYTFRDKSKVLSMSDFIKQLIQGEIQETYWFLYTYIAILIVLPFIRYVAINITPKELFLLTILKVTLDLLPLVFTYFKLSISTNLISELSSLSSYAYYVVLGYCLNKYYTNESRSIDFRVVALFLIGILLPSIFTTYSFLYLGEIKDTIVGKTTVLLSISVFLSIKRIFDNTTIEKNAENIIFYLGSCTFSVYLLEQLSRILLRTSYLFLIENIFGVIASSVYAIEVFLLSLFIGSVLKKIPIMRSLL